MPLGQTSRSAEKGMEDATMYLTLSPVLSPCPFLTAAVGLLHGLTIITRPITATYDFVTVMIGWGSKTVGGDSDESVTAVK